MDPVIASILPYAVAVALSPLPIAALFLMLLSNKAASNSVAFLVGWLLGLAAIVSAAIFLAGQASAAPGESRLAVKALIDGTLGIILVFLALKQWKERPHGGVMPPTPKWMQAVESFSPIKALGSGLLLATVNVKNLPMGIAAGVAIGQAAQTNTAILTGIIGYVVIAGSTILVPVVGFLFVGNRLKATFESLKSWLIYNNATIMFVLFLILGADLLSKAFS